VRFRTGVEVGKTMPVSELRGVNDAVVICGAPPSARFAGGRAQSACVHFAMEFSLPAPAIAPSTGKSRGLRPPQMTTAS